MGKKSIISSVIHMQLFYLYIIWLYIIIITFCSLSQQNNAEEFISEGNI